MIIKLSALGAIGDGRTVNTKIIQKAIDDCAGTGGRVIIDDGHYVSGTLFLKSNVTIEICEGSSLIASPDIADYSCNVHHNRYRNETELDRCFIYAEDVENIKICGEGIIKGNSELFPNSGSTYRPMLIRFLRCRSVKIESLRLFDAAAWTCAFLDSEYIWVTNVWIKNEKKYNGDGLDFDGCNHVYVNGCSIEGTDDNLCLQASDKKYPVEEIHISNCSFTSICAGIRIGLKSIGDIRNVVISNCSMNRILREGIKIECTEGGTISSILVNNISMNNVRRPIFVILNNRFEPEGLGSSIELNEMPNIGILEKMSFTNIVAVDDESMCHEDRRFGNDIMGAPYFNGIKIDACKENPIKDVNISNLTYKTYGGVLLKDIPDFYPEVIDKKKDLITESAENYYPTWSRASHIDIRNVDGLTIKSIVLETIKADERKKIYIEECKNNE